MKTLFILSTFISTALSVLSIDVASAQAIEIVDYKLIEGGHALIDNPKTFTVTVTGGGPITYQWFKNNLPIVGATSSSYTINRVQYSDAGLYKVAVSSPSDVVVSDNIELQPGEAPYFISHPAPYVYDYISKPNALSAPAANAISSRAVNYQWYYSGGIVSGYWLPFESMTGENKPTLSFPSGFQSGWKQYRVRAGISSPTFQTFGYDITVGGLPANAPIIKGISGRRVYTEGEKISLKLIVSNPSPTLYPVSFQYNSFSGPWLSSDTFEILNARVSHSGEYTLRVKNEIYTDSIVVDIKVMAAPKKTLTENELAVIVNDLDPYSVAIAEYYKKARNIPEANIIHIQTPVITTMTRSQFAVLKSQIESALPSHIQAMAIAWKSPARVECNSITSALTRGFDPSPCESGTTIGGAPKTCSLGTVIKSEYFDSESNQPYTDHGIRPSMMLAAPTLNDAKAMIDRGVLSDGTKPMGSAYIMKTSDGDRSARADNLVLRRKPWPIAYGFSDGDFVDTQLLVGDSIPGKKDVMFYFTGLKFVPKLKQTTFLPGAVMDSLTSFSGSFTTTSQMSILEFIKAGATGAFGTVTEPCVSLKKFPNPRVMINRYTHGDTLIEAYWKSLEVTFQGQFIGEPLAAPYRKVVIETKEDPYYSSVVLHMHLDGSDGSKVISDTKGHPASVYGDAQISTANSKFNGASLLLDGTGDYITFPDSSDWTLGANDYTIELWWRPAATAQRRPTVLAAQGSPGSAVASAWWLELTNVDGRDMTFYAAIGDKYQTTYVPNHGMIAGNWYHIAVVRSGSKSKIFINGVDKTNGGATITGALNDSAVDLSIGGVKGNYGANGNIDEFRITRGVARYSSSFTPSLKPFYGNVEMQDPSDDPYYSNVVLLTHFVGNDYYKNFSDTKNHRSTVYGDAKVSFTNTYFGDASLLLDGTGDYITFEDSPDWTLGTEDYTIELWWRPATTAQRRPTVLAAQGSIGNAAASAWWLELTNIDGRDLTFYAAIGDKYQTTYVPNHGMTAGNWYHIAVVRSGTNSKVFINGLDRTNGGASLVGAINDSAVELSIGDVKGKFGANGNIDEFRFTKGIARYRSNFVPQNVPFYGKVLDSYHYTDLYFSNVVLLAHMDGPRGSKEFRDERGHPAIVVGDSQVSTEVSKFGGGSLLLDGTGDYITFADSPHWTLGAQDYTIEFWWRPTSTVQKRPTVLAAQGSPGSAAKSAWWIELTNVDGRDMTFFAAIGDNYQTTNIRDHGMITGKWYHIAVVRSGANSKIFINGVDRTNGGVSIVGALNDSAVELSIGDVKGKFSANGYIDEFRITKGFARYRSNFTPQLAPFYSDSSPYTEPSQGGYEGSGGF